MLPPGHDMPPHETTPRFPRRARPGAARAETRRLSVHGSIAWPLSSWPQLERRRRIRRTARSLVSRASSERRVRERSSENPRRGSGSRCEVRACAQAPRPRGRHLRHVGPVAGREDDVVDYEPPAVGETKLDVPRRKLLVGDHLAVWRTCDPRPGDSGREPGLLHDSTGSDERRPRRSPTYSR